MIYNGVALHSSFENGRRSCTISVHPHQITFSTGENEIKFPMHRLEISSGGAGNRLVYFKHPDFPEWCFYSGDNALLKDPYLSREEGGRKSLARVKSGRSLLVSLLASTVLLMILIAGTLILFRKEIVFTIAETVPVAWEEAAGDAIFESVTLDKEFIEDSILQQQVNHLGSLLTRQLEEGKFNFKFYLVEDSTLNAFALPGGNVVIHSGLIMQAEKVEELLGVLAHEIAHITERHHARGLISRMGVTFILSTFFVPDSELADLIINTGGTLQSLKYDRELESEADEKGWEYLINAGIDPEGMITFFHKLEKQSEGYSVPDFLSTHPNTAERIEELRKKEKDGLAYPSVDFDFEAFKERLKKHINN